MERISTPRTLRRARLMRRAERLMAAALGLTARSTTALITALSTDSREAKRLGFFSTAMWTSSYQTGA